MNHYAIICLDNNPISVEQYQHELTPFTGLFDLYCVDSISDAQYTLDFIHQRSQIVALVIACHHDALNGADFLIQLDKQSHTKDARKVLISAGKDIQVILSAVNEGRLDHALTKPLPDQILYQTAYKELTQFILDTESDNLLDYSQVLDQKQLLRAHVDNSMRHFRQGFIHDYHQMSDTELAEKVIVLLYAFFEQKDETHACRTYSPNHLLTQEGEENQFLWFITQGEVALFKRDELGHEREVVRHQKGNLVGGMSFVTGEASFSTAVTLTKTHVIKLDREVFAKVMHSNSQLLPLFTNLLLRHFNRRLQRSITTKLELQKTLESLEATQQQLVEREKLAVLGQLVAGVAHELNNPVAAIQRGAETLTEQIQWVFNTHTPALTEQATALLHRAMTVSPLSTSEERQRVKALENQLPDRSLAKKLVKLQLDHDRELIEQLTTDKTDAKAYVHQLEHYMKTGNALRSVLICAQRITDMVKGLKSYARKDDEGYLPVNIHEGIEDTLVIFENRLKRYQLIKEYAENSLVYGQPTALQQVWVNLLSNALDALPEHNGKIEIHTRQVEHQHRAYLCVTVNDNGTGIPAELQDRIFELNFTTKKEGNFGLGIGLSVCQQIIQQHQGWIQLNSQVGEGTTIDVYLPLVQSGIDKHMQP
ncbi:ATP-binding protein [Vibrio gazogenes]|uniref:histidine kinase n=1 Tax=Vibrio gazogenes DSM 21264 = NBRC 103151 TaxID=1123492 RepID=A0A1M4YK70_VIBGA|nr:ATP-binding protein [Vibrio gazogenes]USP15002.1 ATP-binding protein [Vibrio gazogenes]SHF05796.1 His Kinase A (phospho-acceptor) domain-containing protein [Vibrio gazogenes DSM 21264] [Vibrio gazogenes DSM 21264 = NBRC 103151]SJN56617.1 C4-dicarboxylate transport sensor protein DctB [Vibrio gazogenes]